jgi:hypothetical protein
VIVTISNVQILPVPVERNAADAPELPWERPQAAVRCDMRASVVLQHLQSAIATVEHDDVASVAIESNAWEMLNNEWNTHHKAPKSRQRTGRMNKFPGTFTHATKRALMHPISISEKKCWLLSQDRETRSCVCVCALASVCVLPQYLHAMIAVLHDNNVAVANNS